MIKKLFIFDLDGTLVDAYDAIAASFNFTLAQLKYPLVSYQKIKKSVGWGDKNLLLPFVDKADAQKALLIYRKHHKLALKKYVHWLPHAQELLHCLKKSGVKLAIASNRPTLFTEIIIDVLKARALFDKVLCADKLRAGKPEPLILNEIVKKLKVDKRDTLYVGDMTIDIQTGRSAGIDTVGVATGSSSRLELKKAKPTYLFKDLEALRHACGHRDKRHAY